jgi:hypothetical protein
MELTRAIVLALLPLAPQDKEFYVPPEAPCVSRTIPMIDGVPQKRRAEDTGIDTQIRRNIVAKSKVWRADTVAPPVPLLKSDPLWLAIQTTIQRSHPFWRQLQVTRVSCMIPKPGAFATFYVTVDGMGVHQCMNRLPDAQGNRCHKKAKIWFEITPNGVVQHCWGSKETKELTATPVACSAFRSGASTIPLDMVPVLYPHVPSQPRYIVRTPSASPPTTTTYTHMAIAAAAGAATAAAGVLAPAPPAPLTGDNTMMTSPNILAGDVIPPPLDAGIAARKVQSQILNNAPEMMNELIAANKVAVAAPKQPIGKRKIKAKVRPTPDPGLMTKLVQAAKSR